MLVHLFIFPVLIVLSHGQSLQQQQQPQQPLFTEFNQRDLPQQSLQLNPVSNQALFQSSTDIGDDGETIQIGPRTPYTFGYMVNDDLSNPSFRVQEAANEEMVTGVYMVNLPDGRMQIVKYTADESGYHAEVSYQGEPSFPPDAPGVNSATGDSFNTVASFGNSPNVQSSGFGRQTGPVNPIAVQAPRPVATPVRVPVPAPQVVRPAPIPFRQNTQFQTSGFSQPAQLRPVNNGPIFRPRPTTINNNVPVFQPSQPTSRPSQPTRGGGLFGSQLPAFQPFNLRNIVGGSRPSRPKKRRVVIRQRPLIQQQDSHVF